MTSISFAITKRSDETNITTAVTTDGALHQVQTGVDLVLSSSYYNLWHLTGTGKEETLLTRSRRDFIKNASGVIGSIRVSPQTRHRSMSTARIGMPRARLNRASAIRIGARYSAGREACGACKNRLMKLVSKRPA